VQFSDVSVQLDVQNMVISETDHVSSMAVTFTLSELALVIDTELLHMYLSYIPPW
jgi:hypothetical protein